MDSVLVRAPMVPFRHHPFVYIKKEFFATGEAAANVYFRNVVPASGDACSYPSDGEVCGRHFDEMENGMISKR
jgi:hypothetical protein